MNSDSSERQFRLKLWALIAEIVGGVAVVVSVVYLAIQINDNTRMLRSQSHYNIIDVLHESAGVLLENPDLVSLLLRCDSQPSRVSIEEWERCSLFYFLQMDGFEYAYYQTVDQAIPDQIWEGVYRAIRQEIARKKGYGRFWEEKGDSFGEAFRTCIDALMALSPYVQTPRQQSRNGEADYCKLAEGS